MEATANLDNTLEERRRALRKVWRWPEAYDASLQRRQACDADLDKAEVWLVKMAAPAVETAESRKPLPLAFAEFGEVYVNARQDLPTACATSQWIWALDMIPVGSAVTECSVKWPVVGLWMVERD